MRQHPIKTACSSSFLSSFLFLSLNLPKIMHILQLCDRPSVRCQDSKTKTTNKTNSIDYYYAVSFGGIFPYLFCSTVFSCCCLYEMPSLQKVGSSCKSQSQGNSKLRELGSFTKVGLERNVAGSDE